MALARRYLSKALPQLKLTASCSCVLLEKFYS